MLKLQKDYTIDIDSLEINDVIDIKVLQKFQDSFALSMGMGTGTIDLDGNLVTKASYFTKFCMDLTHSTTAGYDRCDKCSRKGGEEATRTGRPYIYRCHAGLIDFAVPIMIENHQIGSIIGGQILTKAPDEIEFKKTAREIDVDEDSYVKAVKEVSVVPEEKINAAAEVLFIVANSLSNQGYEQLKLKAMLTVLLKRFSLINADMEKLSASSDSVSSNQKTLNDEIANVKKLSDEVNKILESIKQIADEITILGINATIESERSGKFGGSFGVIAKEIRNLAQSTKETVQKISQLTVVINQSVNKTMSYSKSTLENAKQQFTVIEDVNLNLQALSDTAQELNYLLK